MTSILCLTNKIAIVVYTYFHSCSTIFFHTYFVQVSSLSPTEENKQLYLNFNPRMQALHHMHRNLHILEKKSLKYVLYIHIIYIMVCVVPFVVVVNTLYCVRLKLNK